MSSAPEIVVPSKSPFADSVDPREMTHADWLTGFKFRHAATSPLAIAAQTGEIIMFADSLTATYADLGDLSKRKRNRLLGSLRTLWTQASVRDNSGFSDAIEPGALARCLFDLELTSDELSGRVEAIMASTIEGRPDRETLVAAYWLLRIGGQRLEPQTRFTFFRWTIDSSRTWLEQVQHETPEQAEPGNGCAAFDFWEIQTLSDLCFPGLKGEKKRNRQHAQAWQAALDACTDSDGTPHARWLEEILPRFSQLAAVHLFANSLNSPLWDRPSQRRLTGMFARTALLCTPEHVAFNSLPTPAACRILLTIAEMLKISSPPGLLELLTRWEKQSSRSRVGTRKRGLRGKMPLVNVQSDWGEWACLRSTWPAPVDACVVRNDAAVPQLEVVVANQPLFAGDWTHELKIDGNVIPATGEWACCCWTANRQAAFIELQLNRENPLQVIRQALLLREESVLLLADSIRSPESSHIEFSRSLPLAGTWSIEEDALSREQALVQPDVRVRVFPWSGPQMRLDRSDESTTFYDGQMRVRSQSQGRGLYVATLFDWSQKRREEPVDWQRVTVAENGQIIPPEIAVGHRLRIGKKQWIIYHSHRPPMVPRSVMGIHTLNESVFAGLSPLGEVTPLVEVEL